MCTPDHRGLRMSIPHGQLELIIHPDVIPVPMFHNGSTCRRARSWMSAQLLYHYPRLVDDTGADTFQHCNLTLLRRDAERMHVASSACKKASRLEQQEIGPSIPQRVLG